MVSVMLPVLSDFLILDMSVILYHKANLPHRYTENGTTVILN